MIVLAPIALVMLGGLYVRGHRPGHGRQARQLGAGNAILRFVTNTTELQQFARSTDHWTLYPGDGRVPNARQIPLVSDAFLPITPGQRQPGPGQVVHGNRKWWGSKDLYLEFKSTAKTALSAAGRADEDWRCSVFRWAMESLWGTSAHNLNVGNIHAHPWASTASIAAGYVWTDRPEPCGGTILTDDRQVVVEYAFADLASYCKYELSWLANNGYGGVLAGYRQGGLDGLKAASAATTARHYAAGTTAIEDLTNAEFHWRLGTRVLGADWTR